MRKEFIVSNVVINTDLQDKGLLFCAWKSRLLDLVCLLLEKDKVMEDKKLLGSSLRDAAKCGNSLLVGHLLSLEGVDVNAQGAYGYTALIRAVINGRVNIVSQLLSALEIDVNVQDEYGLTALIVAAINGRGDIVSQILNVSCIGVNIKDEYGYTALTWAIRRGRGAVVDQLLGVPEIDMSAQDRDGKTAFIHGLEKGDLFIISLLLKKLVFDCDGFEEYIPATSIMMKSLKYLIYSGKALDNGLLSPAIYIARLDNICSATSKYLKFYKCMIKIKKFLMSLSKATADEIVLGFPNPVKLLAARIYRWTFVDDSLSFPNRIKLLAARICGVSFADGVTFMHTGMCMEKFIWVSSLMRVAKLTKISHGFNSYIVMHMLMLRSYTDSVLSILSDINMSNVMEFLLGIPWGHSLCELSSQVTPPRSGAVIPAAASSTVVEKKVVSERLTIANATS